MKLTDGEKAEIKQQRRKRDDNALAEAKEAEKAELAHSPVLHPFKTTRSQAQKYSNETKQNLNQIIGPPRYTREQALSHEYNKFRNMNPLKKVGIYVVLTILLVFILGGIFL